MKKLIIIYILILFIFLELLLVFALNQNFISNYNEGIYDIDKIELVRKLSLLSYIPYYNKGNAYYRKDDFDSAIEQYKKALELHPPEKKECSIRINLALAMFYKINFKVKTQEEINEIIKKIDEIKDILIEDGCAHRDDNNGHSSEAQKLKNELDMIQEALSSAEPNEEPDDNDDGGDDQKEEPQQPQENSKEKQLQEIQKEGMNERNNYMKYKESSMNYDYYKGKRW